MIINKDYRIESDDLNVTLLKRQVYGEKSPKCGEEYWVAVGYWGNVEHALKGLVDLRIKGTGMKDLETVVDGIKSIKKDIGGLK